MSPDNPESAGIPSLPQHSKGSLDVKEGHASFPIVGIGASAGGLEAITHLLSALPAGQQTGMAFVLVQHLDPTHESRLSDILTKSTRMPVLEATHGLAVMPDHIYIISPNTTLTIAQGNLQVTTRVQARGPHLPIDHFFKSLAADRRTGAIGVILSGSGTDGTLGLEEVKAAGGITFAQDEQSAKYPGMPQSAVRSGCVDVVLSPEEIAGELVRLSQHPYMIPAETEEHRPAVPEAAPDDDQFKKILRVLRSSFNVDFGGYRDTTIKRRIMRRMVLRTQDSLADYARHLEQDRAELDALYQDILINVTSFFREPETFEALKQSVFPEIIESKNPHTPIRIWAPGCSTGQEAYSLAIALLEFLEERAVLPAIQIFASDLSDTVSLQKAREGIYPENIEGEVSPERLRRFFTKEDSKYRVSKAIRDLCVFARQNVAADPPFSRVDLISCRNLLIYLAQPLQKRVISTFHYALNPTGFLMLGASETVGSFTDLFNIVDQKHCIYAKKATAGRHYPYFKAEEYQAAGGGAPGKTPVVSPADWQREADRIALGQYAPPGVLVNENFDVLQFRGDTGPYLAPAPGEPSYNLLKMARQGLFVELRGALTEYRQKGAAVHRQGVRVRGEGLDREIDLHVLPLKLPHAGNHCFLILFEETARRASVPQEAVSEPSKDGDGSEAALLRQELVSTREYLQSVIEQQDAANEELKSANEEILSGNEELQSTNEELETAKEELQSMNEELTTVNEQLQNRNQELSRLGDALTNLQSSANVAMVELGIDLRVRRFTPAAAKLLNLLPGDVGRPLDDLSPVVEVPELKALVTEVIDTVQVKEREVRDRNGRWYALRVNPYRTGDNRIDGAVAVFVDIEEIKSAQAKSVHLAAIVDSSSDAIISKTLEGVVTSWNQAAVKMFGYAPDEIIGQSIRRLIPPERHYEEEQILARLKASERVEQFETERLTKTGQCLPVSLTISPVKNREGKVIGASKIVRDITKRKQLGEELNKTIGELKEADRKKNDFIALLSHELRNPLAPIYNALAVLRSPDASESQASWSREVIDRQVNQMTRLLDDLLDISRITGGKLQLRKGPVELAKVIESAIETSQPEIEAAGHKLMTDLPTEQMWLDADLTRLAEVFSNLLTNAAKYTDRGGQVWLTAGRQGNEAVVTVKDSGIGIAKDLLPHIFDMFVQGERGLQRIYGGLGLGLTLARELAQMHGGSIEARSEGLGKGSEFIVRLPLGEAREPVANSRGDFRLTASHKLPEVKRVLVVDDSAIHAQSLGMFLEMAGYEVRTARDGLSALEVLTEFVPDVALIDIGLPGLDGYDLARAIHDQPQLRNMVLVAQTGWGREEDRRSAQAAGFDYHLTKPIDPEDVLKLLAGLADRSPE